MGKRVFVSTAASLFLAGSSAIQAQTTTVGPGTITVQLHDVVTLGSVNSPAFPDYLTTTGVAGDSRLFVVDQTGKIEIINGGGSPTTFLDVSSALSGFIVPSLNDERGLLGLAFSPNYATDHKLYTFTSENPGVSIGNAPTFTHPELSGNGSTQTVIREWTVDAAGDNTVNTGAGSRVLMRIRKPQDNHNGGTLAFGPDGYLYISLGDGGGANDNSGGVNSPNDGHSNSVSGGPPGNGQDVTNVYGSILRIKPTTDADVNTTASSNGQYRIPNSNPFSGVAADVQEIFAYGLRNPYRISFDSDTGKLYAADVGQGAQEEVDVIVNGGNYGWVTREGLVSHAPDSLIDPIGAYTHQNGNGIAAIGGFVYRGSLLPALEGKYVFGDLGGNNNGKLYYMNVDDPGPNTIFSLLIGGLGDALPASDLHGFGEDANGEIYAMFSNGQVVELVPEPPALYLAALGAAGMLWQIRRRTRSIERRDQ